MSTLTFYDTVYEDRVKQQVEDSLASVAGELESSGRHIEAILRSMATRAYIAGMRDGFAQGVAAETARREPQ